MRSTWSGHLAGRREADGDVLDARLALVLQAAGRASWRDIAQFLGTSESTVARRARALIASGVLRITTIADPIRCGVGYPVLIKVSCEPGAIRRVARALAARDDVRFVGLVTGRCDVLAEVITSSSRHLGRLLTEELPAIGGVSSTDSEPVLRQYKGAPEWSRQLVDWPPVSDHAPPDRSTPAEPLQLDATDWQIVRLLQEDGRRTNSEIAEALELSEASVRRRIDAMVGRGCINTMALIDSAFLGYRVEAFTWLTVELSALPAVAARLAERSEVRYLAATSGRTDLVAELIVPSQDDLFHFRVEVLGNIHGIISAETTLVIDALKRSYVAAPPGSEEASRVGGSAVGTSLGAHAQPLKER
jgi:DNA-binding Lrp family transcriptional regulator